VHGVLHAVLHSVLHRVLRGILRQVLHRALHGMLHGMLHGVLPPADSQALEALFPAAAQPPRRPTFGAHLPCRPPGVGVLVVAGWVPTVPSLPATV
jgi:hypothetical protein